MRNLVIKREKSFVGCAGKYKVYIEDPASTDLKIKKESYRKLGVLKNGEEAVFQIPDSEAKLYIIGGKVSKSFCNEMVRIPAGETDVYLLGKSKYNPFLGNPFRLEGQVSEETKQVRKSSKKFMSLVYLACVIFGFLIGFLIGYNSEKALAEPETFTVNGMEITLVQEFVEVPYDDVTAAYQTTETLVVVNHEAKPIAEGYEDLTLEEYGELLILTQEDSGIVCSDLKTENGLFYFEYQASVDGETFYYKDYVYEATDAFWHVTFICYNETSFVTNISSISEWAQSVKFNETV